MVQIKTHSKSRNFKHQGTRDLLPPETELWNRVEQTAHEVFATFGFGEIRPPIFEPTELFARSLAAKPISSPKKCIHFRFIRRKANLSRVRPREKRWFTRYLKRIVTSFTAGGEFKKLIEKAGIRG